MWSVSYKLAITPEASADLDRLVASLPATRRSIALGAVLTELQLLAEDPTLAVKRRVGRPSFRFKFVAEDVGYWWEATFQYSQDESTVVITHLYRIRL